MQARAWLPVLALLALAPLAAAAYGPGSWLAADAPVSLDGQVDSTFPGGTASFLGEGVSPFVLLLTGDELAVTVRTLDTSCSFNPIPGTTPTCVPADQPDDEEVLLTDARVTLKRTLSSYKVVVTTDRSHADTATFGETGRLLATTIGTTQLGANPDALHLSGSEDGWTAGDGAPRFEPVYQADALSSEIRSANALVRALGGFETFLQGFEVRVTGTTPDGASFDESFDTATPASAEETYRVVIVEAHDGDLSASGPAPFVAYAPADQAPASDVHERARFAGATGELVVDDDTETKDGEDVQLAGPLHLKLDKIEGGATPRLTYTIVDGLQLDGVADPPRDAPLPPGALAAAGAAGAGGAGLLIALAWFWPRLKYALTLALLPMYTRIERDAVLEHEKRDELYELIRQAPGIHAHEIGEKAHIGWGTTVYHLKLLENHGLIVSKKSGRYKRFFVNTGEYTKKKDVYGALRNETAKAVADYIVNHPGTTQKEMCAALGIQPSLASWHVEKLEGVDLVKRVKDGRMVRYYAGPAWEQLSTSAHSRADAESGAAS